MKKLLILLVSLSLLTSVHASDAAKIKINISGTTRDNTYFLCLPTVGCLSILAAKKGKVFPVMHPVQMSNIYVTNTKNFRVYAQGRPTSCNVTVDPKRTITISGKLSVNTKNNVVRVNQMRCSVS